MSHEYIKNPYADTEEPDELVRVSAMIPRSELALIKSVHPTRGVVQAIINSMFFALIEDMKNNNISYYTPDNERFLIENVRRRTAVKPAE